MPQNDEVHESKSGGEPKTSVLSDSNSPDESTNLKGVANFNRDDIKRRLALLADENIFIGTSSWKYPGWRGMLYDEARYVWRGKFAESRFEKNCLTEYGEIFKTVGVDGVQVTTRLVLSLVEMVAPVEVVPSVKQVLALAGVLWAFQQAIKYGQVTM